MRDCDAHHIDRAAIRRTGESPTAYTDVMTVAGSGRRTFFHHHGANALLDRSHFALHQTSARVFYLGYLGLLSRLDRLDRNGRTPAACLLEEARTLGLMTVADLVSNETSKLSTIVKPSLPHVDYLLLNEYELARLVDEKAGKSRVQLEHQAHVVLKQGVHRAVVVHWPEGSLCVGRSDGVLYQPSVRIPPESIVGTAGAGDAFSAGFIFGLHKGWELQRCLELGVCTAATSLRAVTCSTAVKPWKSCLAFGRRFGFR